MPGTTGFGAGVARLGLHLLSVATFTAAIDEHISLFVSGGASVLDVELSPPECSERACLIALFNLLIVSISAVCVEFVECLRISAWVRGIAITELTQKGSHRQRMHTTFLAAESLSRLESTLFSVVCV